MSHDETMSSLKCSNSTESFITPVSSTDDLNVYPPQWQNCINPTVSKLITESEVEGTKCKDSIHCIPEYSSVKIFHKCSDSNQSTSIDVDEGNESLFVLFDPSCARNNRKERDIGYETGSSTSTNMETMSSSSNILSSPMHMTKRRPMQIVSPAVNHTVESLNLVHTSSTPALICDLSTNFTPRKVAVDRSINNIAGNSTPPWNQSCEYESYSQTTDNIIVLTVILQNQDKELCKLLQDNRDLKCKLQDTKRKVALYTEDMTAKVQKLTDDKEFVLNRVNKLTQGNYEKLRNNKQMSIVVEEYYKTLSWFIEERTIKSQQYYEIQECLISDRDQALLHLYSLDISYKDLFAKYEKCKTIILENNKKEKTLRQRISDFNKCIDKYESVYEKEKQVSTEDLLKVNELLANMKKTNASEIIKHIATIKKHEVIIQSLQKSVIGKDRENKQLSLICDDFIN